MSYGRAVNYEDASATVDDVIAALWATDPREHLIVREGWPGGSCENVVVAVAAVLEQRGFGRWNFVRASRPNEQNGHAWLEMRDSDGTVQFSIDPTLHQFPRWSGPFVGEGATPAADMFTFRRDDCVIWELD